MARTSHLLFLSLSAIFASYDYAQSIVQWTLQSCWKHTLRHCPHRHTGLILLAEQSSFDMTRSESDCSKSIQVASASRIELSQLHLLVCRIMLRHEKNARIIAKSLLKCHSCSFVHWNASVIIVSGRIHLHTSNVQRPSQPWVPKCQPLNQFEWKK